MALVSIQSWAGFGDSNRTMLLTRAHRLSVYEYLEIDCKSSEEIGLSFSSARIKSLSEYLSESDIMKFVASSIRDGYRMRSVEKLVFPVCFMFTFSTFTHE